jgi:hypothetical protein
VKDFRQLRYFYSKIGQYKFKTEAKQTYPEKSMIYIKYICQETDQIIQTSVPYSYSDSQIEALYPGYWLV